MLFYCLLIYSVPSNVHYFSSLFACGRWYSGKGRTPCICSLNALYFSWIVLIKITITISEVDHKESRPPLSKAFDYATLASLSEYRFHDDQGQTMWPNWWLGWREEEQGREKEEKEKAGNNGGNWLEQRSHRAHLLTQGPPLTNKLLSLLPRSPLVPAYWNLPLLCPCLPPRCH